MITSTSTNSALGTFTIKLIEGRRLRFTPHFRVRGNKGVVSGATISLLILLAKLGFASSREYDNVSIVGPT